MSVLPVIPQGQRLDVQVQIGWSNDRVQLSLSMEETGCYRLACPFYDKESHAMCIGQTRNYPI
jgi:hypothetical protein